MKKKSKKSTWRNEQRNINKQETEQANKQTNKQKILGPETTDFQSLSSGVTPPISNPVIGI
jgi:hypothetical protein